MKSSPDELYKQTLTILAREVRALRVKSIGGQLPIRDANTLVKYAKLLVDLKKMDDELKAREAKAAEAAAKTKTIEDLEKIVTGAGGIPGQADAAMRLARQKGW